MRNKIETTVFFYDVGVSARSKKYAGLPPLNGKDIFDLIVLASKSDVGVKQNVNKKVFTYISHSEVQGSKGCLLISQSDLDAADPAFSIPKKRRRVVAKDLEEGLEGSGHLVMNFTAAAPNTYSLILEGTPGLSTAKVQQYLNYLLRVAKSLSPKKFMFQIQKESW